MRHYSATRAFAAAGITAAASTLCGLATGVVAHADVTGTAGLTVQGSTFTVGQTYTITLSAPTLAWCYPPTVMDATDGVTLYDEGTFTVSNPSTTADCPAGQWTTTWTPTTPGVHVISASSQNIHHIADPNVPPAADLGSVTVTVSGTGPSGPTVCTTTTGNSTAATPCMTLHGTPEVGCTVTATFTNVPATLPAPGSGPSPLGQALGSAAPLSAQTDPVVGAGLATTTTKLSGPVTNGTATVTWQPATAGTTWVASLLLTPTTTNIGGGMWVPVAPAGTQPCV